ncbi:MAG: DNA repair and recombination protein RadA [Candidatus Nanohaloarchaeota archaeon QJJ-7]|nr:DNA repair and recombination protein RadA [Candidatus Nanohaloarchaeota archaeon QJJ-7]
MTDDLTELPGVGDKTAEKLEDAGYGSLESIGASSAAELQEAADIGEKTAQSAISAAHEQLDHGYSTGKEKLEERDAVNRIATGSEEFDELMGGGVESHSITEVYGEYGSGKTQVALQLTVNVQKGEEGKKAVFIDTEDTFMPERVKQMAEAEDMDAEEVLDNIFVARAFNSDHQILLGDKAQEICEENDIGLIVVDSLTGEFRSDYVGRGQLAERQQKLNKHMKNLKKLASTYNAAVMVTNQVMSNPDQMFGDPTKAIGGHIAGHNSTFRIYLRKSKKDKRVARLVDSPYLPEGEAAFKITEEGIRDA